MAQSAAALQLQDSNGSQQDQGKAGPAARLASIGRDLAASCAGVALATAVVQLVASYVGKARDAFANQLRSLPGVEKVRGVVGGGGKSRKGSGAVLAQK